MVAVNTLMGAGLTTYAPVYIVTGQSSGVSCQLPHDQIDFLKEVLPVLPPYPLGFPWDQDKSQIKRDQPHIILARRRLSSH